MPTYLTQAWLDRQRELAADFPEEPGATARSQTVITGTPGGDVVYHMAVQDGRIVALELGGDADAEFVITMAYDDAVQIQQGLLDMPAAFMQGRLKVDGNMGKLAALLPLTQSPYYLEMQEKLRAETELA